MRKITEQEARVQLLERIIDVLSNDEEKERFARWKRNELGVGDFGTVSEKDLICHVQNIRERIEREDRELSERIQVENVARNSVAKALGVTPNEIDKLLAPDSA